MTAPSPSRGFLSALVDELRETGEDAIAMFEGREPVDPIFLMDACATAGLLERAHLESDICEIRDRLYRAAQLKAGRAIFAENAKLIDLGPDLDLDPGEDELEQSDRLHRLVELGGLATLADEATRARLVELFERNAGHVLADFDRFETLHESALFFRDALPISRTHPLRTFVDDVIAATGPVLWEIDEALLQDKLDESYQRAIAAIPWWSRLRKWVAGSGERIADFLEESCARPVVMYASSHGPERVPWPQPRLVLAARDDAQLALLGGGHGVLLEWYGLGPPPESAQLVERHIPLMPTTGPLPGARYWLVEIPAELIATAAPPTLELLLAHGAGTWRVSLSDAPLAIPTAPTNESQFKQWRHFAPGAARELLSALAADPSTARHAEARAALVSLPLKELRAEIGLAYFPVVSAQRSDFPGLVAAVRVVGAPDRAACGTLSAGSLQPVRDSLRALVVAATTDLDAFSFVIDGLPDGVQLEGRSWELAALGALVSRVLGVEPQTPILTSGALGHNRDAIAVGHLEEKSALIGRESPDASAILIENDTELAPILRRWFGDALPARLAERLGSSAASLSRQALVKWRAGYHEVAARLAQASLDAGVAGLERADALWIRGGALLHQGRTAESMAAMLEARDTYAVLALKRRLRTFAAEEIESYIAIAHIDQGHPTRAIALLEPLLARLDGVLEADRDDLWDTARLQVAGSLARAHGFRGELVRAISLLRESLRVSDVPTERARTLADLAEYLRRCGDSDSAATTLADAELALMEITSSTDRARTARFRALYACRAGLASPRAAVLPADWTAWPQPAEVLETLLTTTPHELASWLGDNMQESAIALVIYRSAVARAVLGWGEHPALLAVFDDIQARLAAHVDLDPEVRDATRGAWAELAARSPY